MTKPTVAARERLKDAYESVPEHNRMFVGDMDTKDIPVRMIIYGDQAIEGWSGLHRGAGPCVVGLNRSGRHPSTAFVVGPRRQQLRDAGCRCVKLPAVLAALYVVMSVCVSFGAAALWTGRGVRTRTVLVALANSLGAPLFLLWRGDGGVVVAAAVTIQAGIIGLLCLNKAYETVTYRMRKRRDPCVVMAQRGDWEGLAVAANRRRLPAKRAEVALRAALSSSRRRPPEERAPLSLLVRLYECVPDATADSWMSAAVPGSHEFTEWLLDRAPRLPRIGGNTLANTTDPRTFQLLAARGVDLDVRSAPGAPTPLLKAATPHIAMLLLKAGADPNATADYQDTPEGWTLQLARREGRSAPHLWSPAKGPSWDDVVGCANEISASIHD